MTTRTKYIDTGLPSCVGTSPQGTAATETSGNWTPRLEGDTTAGTITYQSYRYGVYREWATPRLAAYAHYGVNRVNC